MLTCCRARKHERQHEQRQQGQPHAPASVACRRVRRSALHAGRRGTGPAASGRAAAHVRAHPPHTRAAPPATSDRCTSPATHPTLYPCGEPTQTERGEARAARAPAAGASAAPSARVVECRRPAPPRDQRPSAAAAAAAARDAATDAPLTNTHLHLISSYQLITDFINYVLYSKSRTTNVLVKSSHILISLQI